MIDKTHKLSIRHQSKLLSINRSSLYKKCKIKEDSFKIFNLISEIYSSYPIYGYRRITAMLLRQGIVINHKRVLRLMNVMNIKAIYPGPNTSKKLLGSLVYRYLLPNIVINKPHKVWQVDITYLRVNSGFMYLVAFIDVYSRLIIS